MHEEVKTYRGVKYIIEQLSHEHAENPRSREYTTKLCIMKEGYVNELDFDFDAYFNGDESEMEKIENRYHVFWIKYNNKKFSLIGTDKTKKVGFIAVPVFLFWTEKMATKEAKENLREYSNYINGEVYQGTVFFEDEIRYTQQYYSYEEIEKECRRIIRDYKKENKKRQMEVEIVLRKKVEVFIENEYEAKEQAKSIILTDPTYNGIISIKVLDSKQT